jgi:hypothetical protein
MRSGAPMASRIHPFAVCCCLAEGFLRQLEGGLVWPSPLLTERIFLEGSLPALRFVR